METGLVRKRLLQTLTAVRDRAQTRRARVTEAERAFDTFLEVVATPLVRQIVGALKAEGYAFTVFTPGKAVRLAADRGRDDYIELTLDTDSDQPQVLARISRTRGSRTIDVERPVKEGVAPDALTEDDVLEFLLAALEPFLER